MAISREELKKKRLKAMGVVGTQLQKSADMYDRISEAGVVVDKAREEAEAAHIGALSAELADLNEMAEDMKEFAQVAPKTNVAVKVAAPVTSTASDALAALQNAQPKLDPKAWADGDAYHGTHGEEQTITPEDVGNAANVLGPKTAE